MNQSFLRVLFLLTKQILFPGWMLQDTFTTFDGLFVGSGFYCAVHKQKGC